MDQLKEEKISRFAALGVAAEDIFREIMRARHLDYVLFQNPSNREYGVSQEDLRKAAEKLTAEKFGPVPGSAETYAYIYSLALSVDPMLFADGAAPVSPLLGAMVSEAVSRAEKAGNTVLFAGAEQYLPCLTDIFVRLRGKRIAVALADGEWKEPVAMIYARGRAMTMDEIEEDTERYDYIFYAGKNEEESLALWRAMGAHLTDGGSMEALLPSEILRSESAAARAVLREAAESCTVSSMYHAVDGGEEKDLITSGARDVSGRIVFGEAADEGGIRLLDRAALSRESFARAESWDYDLYAWNGSEALQTILAAGLLDPDFAAGSVYKAVLPMKGTLGTYPVIRGEAVTESCVRADLVKEEAAADVKRAEAGDLLLTVRGGRLISAVLPETLSGAAAAGDVIVLRPVGEYTAEYLKVYLDGPVGALFLDAMSTESGVHACASRLLRVPVRRADAERIAQVTDLVRRRTAALAAAEAAWRAAKRDSVGLMMGE